MVTPYPEVARIHEALAKHYDGLVEAADADAHMQNRILHPHAASRLRLMHDKPQNDL